MQSFAGSCVFDSIPAMTVAGCVHEATIPRRYRFSYRYNVREPQVKIWQLMVRQSDEMSHIV